MSALPEYSNAQILQQENTARFSAFDFTSAWQIGSAIRERAALQHAPVAIEVYAYGQIAFLAALPGSAPENLLWARRKRNTVLLCGHASLYVGQINDEKGSRMEQHTFLDQHEYTDHGGSFPLMNLSGNLIGAVSVSGLPSVEDHALALWGIQQALA